MTNEYIQVFTTSSTKDDAQRIARSLIEKRVAACVQVVGPITSTYWWKGAIETSDEWLCIIKSQRTLYGKIEQAIREVHSYETPEIIAMPIVAGSDDYLAWLRRELHKT